jgi:hypothetical protein
MREIEDVDMQEPQHAVIQRRKIFAGVVEKKRGYG